MNPKLEALLSETSLPGLPQTAIRLLQLSEDPNIDPHDFSVPIESDPGLAGQVLKFVNSSYFGFSREIASIKLAVTLVGMRTIKNFALWSAVFSAIPNPKCGPFDLRALWQDSLRRGLFARAAAKQLGLREAEEAFMAGLLQDMAIPVLADHLTEEYEALFIARADGASRLSDLEREALGFTHAEAAAVLAQRWNLPEGLQQMIAKHVDIDCWQANDAQQIGQGAVALSAMLPTTTSQEWSEREDFMAAATQFFTAGGVDGVSLLVENLFSEVDGQFSDFAVLMKLPEPDRSLVDILEVADEVSQPTEAA